MKVRTRVSASRLPDLIVNPVVKQYADYGVSQHAANEILHLTVAQNAWLDAITATSAEVNYLGGVTSSIQTQLNNKLSLSGGSLTGFLVLHSSPETDMQAATKVYVDNGLSTKFNSTGGQIQGYVGFDSEQNFGNSTGSVTFTFTKNKTRTTLTGNTTATFSFPNVGSYQLKLIQDATGNRTFSYAVTPKFVGSATAPEINVTSNSETILSLYWDGTNCYVAGSKVGA